MGDQLAAIRRIIEAFERSEWDEIDVRYGDIRVRLSTHGGAAPQPVQPSEDAPAVESPSDPPGDAVERSTADRAPAAPPPGVVHVSAPSPGIFWRSPEPGAPPFVEVGADVEVGATLCIVEVMKLMSHVKAGVAGRVVEIFAVNGTAVEKGEPLVALAVDGESDAP